MTNHTGRTYVKVVDVSAAVHIIVVVNDVGCWFYFLVMIL